MIFMLLAECYLIMRAQEEVKLLLLGKLRCSLLKKVKGSNEILKLGNIYAKRDWGHAKDYVEMQWRIMQQKSQMIML